MKHAFMFSIILFSSYTYAMEQRVDKKFRAVIEEIKEKSALEIVDALNDIEKKRSKEIGEIVRVEFMRSVSDTNYTMTDLVSMELQHYGLVKPDQKTVASHVREIMTQAQKKQKQTEQALEGLEMLMQAKK